MHAPAQLYSTGSKLTKVAIVAAMHAGLIAALIGMKVVISKPTPPVTTVDWLPTPKAPPPDSVNVDLSTPDIAPPSVTVQMPRLPQLLQTITVPEVVPGPDIHPKTDISDGLKGGTIGGTGTAVVKAAEPRTERVYQAALANANGCALPTYPAASARNGDTGTVTMSLLIGTNGKVSEARVARSSGHPALDRAAIAALQLCSFKPASTNGVPEAAWGQIAYVWTLDE